MAKATSFMDTISSGETTEETALVVHAESMPSRVLQTGSVAFDASEMATPYLRLAQGSTQEVQEGIAKPGQWLVTGFPPADTVLMAPIYFARTRDYYIKGADDKNSRLCYSPDGVTGYGDPGGRCDICPKNQWLPNPAKAGTNLPPACNITYTYICYDLRNKVLVELGLRKTSLKAAKQINTLAATRGLGTFAVELGVTKVTGGRGIYHVPTVKVAAMTEDAQKDIEAIRQNFTPASASPEEFIEAEEV